MIARSWATRQFCQATSGVSTSCMWSSSTFDRNEFLPWSLVGLSHTGMSSVKHNVWFGWNVKNFAQKLLIRPRIDTTWRVGGGVDRHSAWKLSFLRWGGRGGEGGVDRHSTWKLSFLRWGGRGGGLINTQLGSCHFLGGEGGEGRGGQSTLNLEVVIS